MASRSQQAIAVSSGKTPGVLLVQRRKTGGALCEDWANAELLRAGEEGVFEAGGLVLEAAEVAADAAAGVDAEVGAGAGDAGFGFDGALGEIEAGDGLGFVVEGVPPHSGWRMRARWSARVPAPKSKTRGGCISKRSGREGVIMPDLSEGRGAGGKPPSASLGTGLPDPREVGASGGGHWASSTSAILRRAWMVPMMRAGKPMARPRMVGQGLTVC